MVIPARAEDPRDTMRVGNDAYAAGKYQDALDAFKRIDAGEDKALLPDALHNLASAAFRLGRYDEARETWTRAASLLDAAFEAKARYNIGNCHYNQVLAAMQAANAATAGGQPATPPPMDSLLEQLGRASDSYRDAIRLDPSLTDARANLELAKALEKLLREQATSQSKPSSAPNQENNQQDENQSSSQPSSQSSTSQSGEDGSESSTQPQSQPSTQPQPQDQPQSQPADSQPATQSMPSSADKAQSQPADDEPQTPPVPIEMTREQAERLLQKIREAERQRREALQARERARHRPVDRDW